MGLIDQLGAKLEAFHAATDEEVLFGAVTPAGYRGYLTRMYGFVCPVERSIQSTLGVERYVDVRRFQKHELLRRDLVTLRMPPPQIDKLPFCSVPLFDTPEEAFGWAYLIERSTLRHGELFRHLASTIPGEVAFASSYLKCYLGMVGEMWRSMGHVLEAFESDRNRSERVIEAARAAIRCYQSWRFLHDQREGPAAAAAAPAPALEGD
jgi:heme oxygenase